MFNSRKIVKIVIAVLLCMVLSACTGTAAVPPSAATHQVIATIMPEIITPTHLPATLKRSPTLTTLPQSSQTPTSTPRSLNPSDILTQQAYDMTVTQIASFPVICKDINPFYSLQSPEGNWLAIPCSNKTNQGLEVVSKEGKRWVLQFKDFIRGGHTGLGGLYPEHWTGDGEYLYFKSTIGYSCGGSCFYGWNADGLFRINVDDGSVTTTLAIPSSGAFYDIAFSPDGRRFAYEYNYDHLAIVDLRTGEEFTIESGDDAVGDLSWSPDGSHLAYAMCRDTQDHTATEKSSIKMYSPETQVSKTILEVKQTLLRIESRNGDPVLKISTYDFQAIKSDILFFDWSTEQITTATPTPLQKVTSPNSK